MLDGGAPDAAATAVEHELVQACNGGDKGKLWVELLQRVWRRRGMEFKQGEEGQC